MLYPKAIGTPELFERMLNSLDRMGNSFERRMASLKGLISLGATATAAIWLRWSLRSECASCNEGHASACSWRDALWRLGKLRPRNRKMVPARGASARDHPRSPKRLLSVRPIHCQLHHHSRKHRSTNIPSRLHAASPKRRCHRRFQFLQSLQCPRLETQSIPDDARTYPPRNLKSKWIPKFLRRIVDL